MTANKITVNKMTARLVGALFLITTAAYATGNGLIESLLSSSDHLTDVSANTTRVTLGAILMFINCVGVVGIGVLMFPILKQHSEAVALSYLGTRIVESILLTMGVISLLLLIPLSQEYLKAGTTDTAYFQTLSTLAIKGNYLAYQLAMIVLGIGSLMFCYLLYQSKLIPRFIAAWGFIGYAALLIGAVLEIFGLNVGLLYSIPGGLFELTLPVWLFVKGFSLSPITSESAETNVNEIKRLSEVREDT
jgi:Domain of unknown function (DUF4386)